MNFECVKKHSGGNGIYSASDEPSISLIIIVVLAYESQQCSNGIIEQKGILLYWFHSRDGEEDKMAK